MCCRERSSGCASKRPPCAPPLCVSSWPLWRSRRTSSSAPFSSPRSRVLSRSACRFRRNRFALRSSHSFLLKPQHRTKITPKIIKAKCGELLRNNGYTILLSAAVRRRSRSAEYGAARPPTRRRGVLAPRPPASDLRSRVRRRCLASGYECHLNETFNPNGAALLI